MSNCSSLALTDITYNWLWWTANSESALRLANHRHGSEVSDLDFSIYLFFPNINWTRTSERKVISIDMQCIDGSISSTYVSQLCTSLPRWPPHNSLRVSFDPSFFPLLLCTLHTVNSQLMNSLQRRRTRRLKVSNYNKNVRCRVFGRSKQTNAKENHLFSVCACLVGCIWYRANANQLHIQHTVQNQYNCIKALKRILNQFSDLSAHYGSECLQRRRPRIILFVCIRMHCDFDTVNVNQRFHYLLFGSREWSLLASKTFI